MSNEQENSPKSEQETSTQQPSGPPPDEASETAATESDPGQLRGGGLDKTLDDPNLPDWARGKTVKDLVQQTQAVMDSFDQTAQQANPNSQQGTAAQQRQQFQQTQQQVQGQQGFGQPQQQQAPQVGQQANPAQLQQAAQQAAQAGVNVPDPDMAYENPDQYRAQLNQAIQQAAAQVSQQQVQQAAQPIMQQMAQTAREQSRRDPELQEVWQKYEPEIRSLVNERLPVQQRTKEGWDTAARLVRDRHFDEFVQQRAQQVAGQAGGQAPATERSAGAPTADGGERTYRDAIDKLWNESNSDFVQHAKRQDLTPDDLRARADQMNVSYEQFAENIEQRNFISTTAGLTETG